MTGFFHTFVVACINISFLFLDEQYPIVWIYCILLSIHQLMDIGLFAFLAVMNIATINIYVWVFGWTYAFSSLKHAPRNGIAVFKLILLTDWKTVLKQLHHFTIPSAVWEVPNFSISFANTCHFLTPFFYYNQSSECEMESHCGFNLCSPDGSWGCPSFHVLTGHLYIFSGSISFQIFCPLF